MSTESFLEISAGGIALHERAVQAVRQRVETQKKRSKVIVIAGPTACGKTDFSIMLAKNMGGEIISADAMQVYIGLDIGTAKASVEQRLEIPHHLIDQCYLSQSFTVVDFYHSAIKAIQSILARNAVPIVVGGSGFYLHTLLYGPPAGPPPCPEIRHLLEAEMEEVGPEELYLRLSQLDPDYAEGITSHDRHKIVRALEVITLTGNKISTSPWRVHSPSKLYDWRCWFLHRPRQALYDRINRRCQKMVDEGLLQEVERMIPMGLRQNSTCAHAIGYRQALSFLDSPRSDADYRRFLESFMRASRHYAKRQFTWFRREPLFRWLDVDLVDFENLMELVMKDYSSRL